MSEHTHTTRPRAGESRATVNDRQTSPSLEEERVSKELFIKATTSQYRFEDERYKFDQIIGRGGMGVVLKGYDKLLSRDVAVKFLSPELNENEDARSIFLSEARAMARLSHKNLVSVYDVGVIEGSVMMVVEFVEGQDLFKLLRQRDPPVGLHQKTVLRVGIQLCRVIGYMHAQNMIHRDIKPANVILQKDGVIKLIDFGLTRALETLAMRATRVRGTPAYMAPEQLEGGQLTPAIDIYQLGVTFFELLTARLPFEKTAVASSARKTPPNVQDFVPDIDDDLARCISRCLAWDPAERPGSAQEIVDIFRSVLLRITGQGTLRNLLEDDDDEATGSIDTSLLYQDSGGPRVTEAPDTPVSVAHNTSPGPISEPAVAPVVAPDPVAPAPSAPQRNLVPIVVGLVVLLLGLGGALAFVLTGNSGGDVAKAAVSTPESTPPVAEAPATPTPPVAEEPPEEVPPTKPSAEDPPETGQTSPEADTPTKPDTPKAKKRVVRRKRPIRRKTPPKKDPPKVAPPPKVDPPKPDPPKAAPKKDPPKKTGPSLFKKKPPKKKTPTKGPSLFKGK